MFTVLCICCIRPYERDKDERGICPGCQWQFDTFGHD